MRTTRNQKQAQLDAITQQIVKDKVCPELAAGAIQPVPGAGNPDADVVFVGEAPGKQEDIQGLPFVGAAGKFLNQLLEMIGLKRDDVFIGNVIKYRPPNNRDPLPEEVAAFLPYLKEQIKVIKPKLIVTLGRFSLGVFLPGFRISQIHGQPKRIRIQELGDRRSQQSVVILPLYHPAAALYNGGMRATLEEDFMKIPQILKQLTKESINA